MSTSRSNTDDNDGTFRARAQQLPHSSWFERRTTARAIRSLGATPKLISDSERRQLAQCGFVVLRDLLPREQLREIDDKLRRTLDAFHKQGVTESDKLRCFVGDNDVYIRDLLNNDPVFDQVVFQPRVLATVAQALRNDVKLSHVHMRMPRPHLGNQPMHLDTHESDMAHPNHYFCNVIWMITDFTLSNGPTSFVPGSHRWHRVPQLEMEDPTAPHPDEVPITGTAGSAIVLDGHVWHRGLENRDGTERMALFTCWTYRTCPQLIDDQRQLVQRATLDRLSAPQRHLVGL